MRATTALRALLKGDGIVVAPGVYDGLSARLARDAGFAAVYATGGGIARSMGFPDLGEVTDRGRRGTITRIRIPSPLGRIAPA